MTEVDGQSSQPRYLSGYANDAWATLTGIGYLASSFFRPIRISLVAGITSVSSSETRLGCAKNVRATCMKLGHVIGLGALFIQAGNDASSYFSSSTN